MSYTFDLTATGDDLAVSRVRSLVDDVAASNSPVEGTHYFLSDARILENLTAAAALVSGLWPLVWQASAFCLAALATNQAYVLSVYKGAAEEFDGAKVADSIRADAKLWESRAQRGVNVANQAESQIDSTPVVYGGSATQSVSW